MDASFRKLIDLLDAEIERQEMLLAVCRAQQQALIEGDREYLEMKTAGVATLAQEARADETARKQLVREIAAALGIDSPEPTLAELALIAPVPVNRNLLERRDQLRRVVRETSTVNQENNRLLRRSLGIVGTCLRTLDWVVSAHAGSYDANGAAPPAAFTRPALLDQKG